MDQRNQEDIDMEPVYYKVNYNFITSKNSDIRQGSKIILADSATAAREAAEQELIAKELTFKITSVNRW